MKVTFYLAFGVVVYTYAGYPILMAALARFFPRAWKRGPVSFSVSIVMAVHNGAAMLPWKVGHLLSLSPELVHEVILISDGSDDGTAELLQAVTDPRARILVLPQQVGKAAALNHGIAAATGDVLLFTDIRPRIEAGALTSMLKNFADPSVGCVAGELIVRSSEAHGATTAAVSGLYWKYEQWIRNCETQWDSPVGVYGGFYAIRRSLATFAPDGLILDDMFQPLSIIRQGFRSVVDRDAIVVDIWPAETAREFDRKVRTLAGNFQLIARAPWVVTPENRVLFQLVSHKLLRLAVPWLFLFMLFSSAVLSTKSALWAFVTAAQAGFWLCAVFALRVRIPFVHRFAAAAGALLVLNLAAIVGLYTFLFTSGPLWKIWSPTAALTGGGFNTQEEQEHA